MICFIDVGLYLSTHIKDSSPEGSDLAGVLFDGVDRMGDSTVNLDLLWGVLEDDGELKEFSELLFGNGELTELDGVLDKLFLSSLASWRKTHNDILYIISWAHANRSHVRYLRISVAICEY